MTIVVLDHDPNQAIELIQKLTQSNPAPIVLPASRCRRQRADPQGDPRRSTRVSAAAGRSRPSCSNDLAAASRPQRVASQPQTQGPRIITVTGATGGVGCTTLAVNLAATLGRDQGARDHLARSRPDVRRGRRLPRHRAGPHPHPRRPELRPARPDPAQAVDHPPRLGPLRPAPSRRRSRRPPRSIPRSCGGCSAC